MIINTNTSKELALSLASYFNITENKLYEYIKYASKKAKQVFFLNEDISNEELLRTFSSLNPKKSINEIYVYHLTRRLNNAELYFNNLKELLLSENVFSTFLKNHNITFFERDNHPILCYFEK